LAGKSLTRSSVSIFNTLNLEFPVLLYGGDVSYQYGVTTVPSVVLVSSDGTVLLSADNLSDEMVTTIAETLIHE